MDTAAVRSAFDLTLVGADVPVLMTAELEYHVHDPYAVTAVFHTATQPVRWVFARDLLDEGLVHDVGLGDVQVVPARDVDGNHVVQLRLASPDGVAVLETSADVILDFLELSYGLVPPGMEFEQLNIDAALDELLPN